MNRLKIILAQNKTLHEMFVGILVSNLLLCLIGIIVSDNKAMTLFGVAEGTVIAFIYCIHMAVTIDDALCLDEKGAMSQMRKHMLIRYFGVCVLVAVICITHIGDPIFCVLSCLTVKLGAYLQPLVHKILNRSEEPSNMTDGSENGGRISE